MMNEKRKELKLFALLKATAVVTIFATSPTILAAGEDDGCISTYMNPCSNTGTSPRYPAALSANQGSTEYSTTKEHENALDTTNGFNYEKLMNAGKTDGKPDVIIHKPFYEIQREGQPENTAKDDGQQQDSDFNSDSMTEASGGSLNSDTDTFTTDEVQDAPFTKKSVNPVTPITLWTEAPQSNPEWYTNSKPHIKDLQENIEEGKAIYRGTERFKQCTGYATKEWIDVVAQENLNDPKTWEARFAKLYEDYVLSNADEGLNNLIEESVAKDVHGFISATNNTECLVKAEGADGPYFINNKFSVSGHFSPTTRTSKLKIECSAKGCAEKYLNPSDNENKSIQEQMFKQNDKSHFIKKEVVQGYMKNLAENAQHALQQGQALYEQLKQCEVYAATTSGLDYKDPYLNNRNTKTSYDKKYTCFSVGVETQDFPSCSDGIDAYDAIFAGRIVVDEAQKLDYMDHSMDAKNKATQAIGTDATAALKYQKDDLKKQAQLQTQKATIEGAALGTLTKYYNEMPTREDLKLKCSNKANKDTFTQLHKYYSDYTAKIIEKLKPYHERHYILLTKENDNAYVSKSAFGDQECGGSGIKFEAPVVTWNNSLLEESGNQYRPKPLEEPEVVKDNTCDSFIYEGKHSLVMNTEGRDVMKGAMVKAGVDVASYLAKAALLKKQAGKIASAVSQVEAFQPTDVSFESNVPSVTDCFKNPDAEGCKVNNDGTIDFYDGSISLGGSGGATISGASGDDSSGAVSGSGSIADRSDVNVPIGTPVASVDKSSGNFESSPAGALGMKKTGAGGAAGGGGGSSAVAPPGGGSRGTGGGSGGGYRGSKANKLSYSGGGSSLNYSSGARRSKSRKSKSSNPFSKLFGKKKGKGGVLNFRDTASGKQIGGKNGDLFNMISQRYGIVSQKKRLQEYESVK